MKARVKATGEIVDVTNLFDDGTAEIGENNYIKVSKIDMDLDGTDGLDMPSEQRMRYELAKAAMQGFEANTSEMVNTSGAKKIVEWSIQIADEMIKQLKESEETK